MKKQLRNVIAQRSQRRLTYTDQAILQNPHLRAQIEAWPPLANSLLPTGRVNELSATAGAYIDTALTFDPAAAADFRFAITGQYQFTPYIWNLHGSVSGRTACCIGFSPSRHIAIGNGTEAIELRHSPELIGQTLTYDLHYAPDGRQLTFSIAPPNAEDGFLYVTSIPVTPTGTRTALHLFRCNGIGATFQGTIRQVIIGPASAPHRLVPYIQDGHCGLLDLTDLTFHPNASPTGVITITEANSFSELCSRGACVTTF